jgi:hypothetical protein
MIKDYYNSLSDYQKGRFDNYKAKAKEFFAKKELIKFYHIEGYDSHSEGDIQVECWLSMTDKDVKQLKEYLLEEYNKFDPEYPCDSWDDFTNTDPDFVVPFFEEMNTKAGLWNDLVVSKVESNYMEPTSIDFNNYTTCYRAKYFCYNEKEDKMVGPYALNLELTDEEYILLLTLQLFEQRGLTFNRLNTIAPDLFKKLNSEAEAAFMNQRLIEQWKFETYTIVFSEIIDDAKKIEPDSET